MKGPVLGAGRGWAAAWLSLLLGDFDGREDPAADQHRDGRSAEITTRGRRQTRRCGVAFTSGGGWCRWGLRRAAAPVGASWVCWPWIGPAVGWSAGAGGCPATVGSGRDSGTAVASRAARANSTVVS